LKLKVAELYGLDESLTELANVEFPIGLALKIKRNLSKVADELMPINDMRTELINDHKGKTDGNMVQIKPNEQEEFYKKYNELMNQEVDIKLDKINLSDLADEDIKVKPKTLTLLEPILREGDDHAE